MGDTYSRPLLGSSLISLLRTLYSLNDLEIWLTIVSALCYSRLNIYNGFIKYLNELNSGGINIFMYLENDFRSSENFNS